ncbi:hypothetical protein GYA13_02495 [Candidatus Kuenenbacteria bacterium]|nr:hypothetical protein [Candidatus Kuenenbacteria bacterium]
MDFIHQNLANGRWFQLSLAEQMGNIGSEIGRAVIYLKRGEKERMNMAMERAFDLFDLTIDDKRWHARGALREILRAKEICAEVFYGRENYGYAPEDLDKYFMQYALAARKEVN